MSCLDRPRVLSQLGINELREPRLLESGSESAWMHWESCCRDCSKDEIVLAISGIIAAFNNAAECGANDPNLISPHFFFSDQSGDWNTPYLISSVPCRHT